MLVARNIYFYQVTLATVRWLNVSAGMPLGVQWIHFPDLSQYQLYLIHPSHKNPTTSPAVYYNGLQSYFLIMSFLASHGLSRKDTENRLPHSFIYNFPFNLPFFKYSQFVQPCPSGHISTVSSIVILLPWKFS